MANGNNQVREYRVLLEVSHLINSTLEIDMILIHAMEKGKEIVKAEACSLMLLDEERDELVYKVALGEKGKMVQEKFRLAWGQGIAGWVAKEAKPLIVNDVRKETHFYRRVDEATGFETRAVLCVPLRVKNKILGVIELINPKEKSQFTQEDLEIFEAFSDQVAIALENARLYENLKQAYEELKSTQEQLIQSEKMAVLGTFSAQIAHEFKNILQALSLHLQLCAKPGIDEETVKSSFQFALRIVKKANEIIFGLLTFARKSESKKELGDFLKTVEDTLRLVEHELATENIRVVREFRALPPVLHDSAQISQVILNMVSNARDAVRGKETAAIEIHLRKEGDEVLCEIKDNGCGIPEDIKKRLFLPFTTTKKQGEGTGLGLSVTFGIVKNHGGRIEVQSIVGKGTTFQIFLPLGDKGAASSEDSA